jgi:hypothetical protein
VTVIRRTVQIAIAVAAAATTLWAVCSYGLAAYDRHALTRATEGQCFILESALELYHLDHGAWPDATTNEEFTRAIYRPLDDTSGDVNYTYESSYENKAAIYVNESPPGSGRMVFRDMWDHEFAFSTEGDRPKVTSPGRDGKFGNSDDITSDKVREKLRAAALPRREARLAQRREDAAKAAAKPGAAPGAEAAPADPQ